MAKQTKKNGARRRKYPPNQLLERPVTSGNVRIGAVRKGGRVLIEVEVPADCDLTQEPGAHLACDKKP